MGRTAKKAHLGTTIEEERQSGNRIKKAEALNTTDLSFQLMNAVGSVRNLADVLKGYLSGEAAASSDKVELASPLGINDRIATALQELRDTQKLLRAIYDYLGFTPPKD